MPYHALKRRSSLLAGKACDKIGLGLRGSRAERVSPLRGTHLSTVGPVLAAIFQQGSSQSDGQHYAGRYVDIPRATVAETGRESAAWPVPEPRGLTAKLANV